LSLSEFEALEARANVLDPTEAPANQQQKSSGHTPAVTVQPTAHPPKNLSSLGGALRERLLTESRQPIGTPPSDIEIGASRNIPLSTTQRSHNGFHHAEAAAARPTAFASPPSIPVLPTSGHSGTDLPKLVDRDHSEPRQHRKTPRSILGSDPTFDQPPSDIVGPRLFASQDRIWQAIAGHGKDLKRVPAMVQRAFLNPSLLNSATKTTGLFLNEQITLLGMVTSTRHHIMLRNLTPACVSIRNLRRRAMMHTSHERLTRSSETIAF
jgi:hypothetical protein